MWGYLAMLLMHRNLKSVWYALWLSKTAVTDTDNYETGEYEDVYSDPVELRCNVSPARAYVLQQMFGPLDPYEKVIITSDMDCPVTETSIFWEHKPKANEPHEYIVRRVARSLNHVSITLRKVNVSGQPESTI